MSGALRALNFPRSTSSEHRFVSDSKETFENEVLEAVTEIGRQCRPPLCCNGSPQQPLRACHRRRGVMRQADLLRPRARRGMGHQRKADYRA